MPKSKIPNLKFEILPLLAITMGDAAGVGPEVIVRAWADPQVHQHCRPVVLGHPEVLRQAVQLVSSDARVVVIEDLSALTSSADIIPIVPVGSDDVLEVPHGTLDARTGQAAYEAVVTAIEKTRSGPFDGIVTAPLSKAALHAAGHIYPGHTELLAERCGVDDFAMMLYLPQGSYFPQGDLLPQKPPPCPAGLGVVHVTLHMALRDVFANLTTEAVLAKCRLAHSFMHDGMGLASPRIGVCALNPHAGEDGLFGDEESKVIAPAVARARELGINAAGPFPTDTLMGRARDGEFDALVAMYHDQGHIALNAPGSQCHARPADRAHQCCPWHGVRSGLARHS